MRQLLLVLLCVAAITATLAAGWADGSTKGWPIFRGTWFTVKYPPGFVVTPREPGATTTGTRPDGVSFGSPGGKVEFYVYSPQWSGTSQWIKPRPGESLIDKKTEESDRRKVTHVTLKGVSGSYRRVYIDTLDKLSNTRTVFGIKYWGEGAYQQYRAQYLLFKQSLVQFTD